MAGFSNAAMGAPALDAVTVYPAGAADTESPCDIHTDSSPGSPANRAPGSATSNGVRPNSLRPVCATSPPSARAITWNP